MKKLIARIRTADRRRLTIDAVLLIAFGGITWTVVQLIGLLVNSNPHNHQPSDGVPAAYILGVLTWSLTFDLMRRADKALTGRFIRKTAEATQ